MRFFSFFSFTIWVLLAEAKGSNKTYAIKVLKKDIIAQDDDVECTRTERNVLMLGHSHPYMCGVHAVFQVCALFFVSHLVD